jgi:hypothetical protein
MSSPYVTRIVHYLISRINPQLCTGAQFKFPLAWRCCAATTASVWQFFRLALEMKDAEWVAHDITTAYFMLKKSSFMIDTTS